MGNPGLDRAGYKQIAKSVNAVIITSTMDAASCTADANGKNWAGFEVISSEAAIALVTADGITNSSLLTSGAALLKGAYVGGGSGGISVIKISTKSTGHKVMAYNRILL